MHVEGRMSVAFFMSSKEDCDPDKVNKAIVTEDDENMEPGVSCVHGRQAEIHFSA